MLFKLLCVALLITFVSSQECFVSNLDTDNEIPPVPGQDAVGTFYLRINNDDTTDISLQYPEEVEGNNLISMIHIHDGDSGMNGPVVYLVCDQSTCDLDDDGPVYYRFDTANETTTGCDGDCLDNITATPSEYYVNVHTDLFLAGFLRGQLENIDCANLDFNELPNTYYSPLDSENELTPATDTATAEGYMRINDDYSLSLVLNYDDVISVDNAITKVHFHMGNSTTNGPVVIYFCDNDIETEADCFLPSGPFNFVGEASADDVLEQCDVDCLQAFMEDPDEYYVNIHTENDPSGLYRAQLFGFNTNDVNFTPTTIPTPSGSTTTTSASSTLSSLFF